MCKNLQWAWSCSSKLFLKLDLEKNCCNNYLVHYFLQLFLENSTKCVSHFYFWCQEIGTPLACPTYHHHHRSMGPEVWDPGVVIKPGIGNGNGNGKWKWEMPRTIPAILRPYILGSWRPRRVDSMASGVEVIDLTLDSSSDIDGEVDSDVDGYSAEVDSDGDGSSAEMAVSIKR